MRDLVTERDVERALKRRVEKALPWSLCVKFVSPGLAGVPDRIIMANDVVVFVEVKRPGEHLRPLQVAVHERMRRAGQTVLTVDSMTAVDLLVEWLVQRVLFSEDCAPDPPESLLGVCSRV